MILETKGFFKKQRIEILSNRLLVLNKNWFNHLEYEILFDDIETKKTVKRELNRDLIFVGVLVMIFAVLLSSAGGRSEAISIIWIICFLFVGAGLLTKKGTIIINSYSNFPIVLNFKKKNEKKTRDFADSIIEKTKDYLINKYGRIDKDLPIDSQLNSIEHLRIKDLIDEKKFEELKNKLIGKNGDERSIGFDKKDTPQQ